MVSVQGVVDRVGPPLLRAVVIAERPCAVTDVVIAEAGRHLHLAAGDLVLAPAIGQPADAAELVKQSGARGAAAVLLKPPLAGEPTVQSAARRAGTSIVEVGEQAAWAQLVWLLRTVLDAAADESEPLDAGADNADGNAFGDLFRLADAVASVVDAPVTIEDANSRVLAYSARQDRTDPARVSTIMGRRVPDDVLARFRSRGVFRELSRGRSVIFVPAQRDGTLPRLIVPIRMGGELLGSMWAVVAGPVADERAAAFADAGPLVALHLLRRRASVDAAKRRSAELVRALLAGTASPRVAAAELDLGDGAHRVLAIDVAAEDELAAEGSRLALGERIAAGIGRRPAVAEMHGVLYAVVPAEPGTQDLRAVLAEAGDPLVAAGSAVALGDLARSRTQAEETLGLLRAGMLPGRAADYDEVWAVLALHRAATAANAVGVAELGPVAQLAELDERDGTAYLGTLYEWLRHPTDPRTAARALAIHPNTLRYRLRRVVELTAVDLDDADVRLAMLTQLIALRWR